MKYRIRIRLPLVAAMLVVSSTALAQNTDGAIQLGLATDLFAHTSTDLEVEFPLVTQDVTQTRNTWGFQEENGVIFEMGYGLTEGLVIGGLAQLGGSNLDSNWEQTADTENSLFEFGLYPKIEYMFIPGGRVRPFVGGGLGLLVRNADDSGTESSVTAFGLWGRGGLRYFVSPAVSLDPTLTLSWLTGSGDYDAGNLDGNISVTRLGVALGAGISIWIP